MSGVRAGRMGAIAAPAPAPPAPVYPVPEEVRLICEAEDWDGFLPPRAAGSAWRAAQRVKRLLDVVLSIAGLLALSPLLALIALAVRLGSAGPILYEWRVLGRRGQPFIGYKFRTMVQNADALKPQLLHANELRGPAFKMRRDPRVTPLGRVLRKYSLDELPQLWSVLKGDMSLVGPRPPSAEEFADFAPWQRGKLAVIPGLTGLWQISGRSDITDFDHWVRLDLEYIDRWSLGLDLSILLRTIPAVLRGDGAY